MIFVRPMAGVETVKKTIAVLVVILSFACNKQESPASIASADASAPQLPAGARVNLPAGAAQAPKAPAPPPSAPRMIVRTADVRIIVGDTSKAVAAVTKSL